MSQQGKWGLSRREFLGTAALAVGGVLAGCTPKATQSPPTGAPAQATESAPAQAPAATAAPAEVRLVEFWTAWPTFVPVWEDLAKTDEYQQQVVAQGYEVKVKFQELPSTLAALASGTAPAGLANIPYLDFMARGVLLPIDEWVAASSVFKKEKFLPGGWEGGFYNGVQYGAPAIECFVRDGLNYNAKMIEEAGLDPEKPPVTWGDCLEWHKALTKFDASGNLLQIGLDPYDAVAGEINYVSGCFVSISWGWDWFNEETGEFDLDNDKMAEAMEIMGEFYRVAGPDNMGAMRQVEGQGTWGGSFNAEVQAMIIEGYWHPGETMNEKPEVGKYNRATWAPVPENRRGLHVQGNGGEFVVFCKGGKNTEGMWKAAEFLQTKAACDIFYKKLGWLPGLKEYVKNVDPTPYPGLEFYLRSVAEADEHHAPAKCQITEYVNQQFHELRELVYRDTMTAADAAKELQKRSEKEYVAAGFAKGS